jgi:hypothetical protein
MASSSHQDLWAPGKSRLGALQRGRGDGYLAALGAGESAAREVVACVIEDPRWDRQVETRDGYYARLLCALDANVDDISKYLEVLDRDTDADDDIPVWLPISVLAEMAVRGHAGARTAVTVAAGRPKLWRPCLEMLVESGGIDLVDAVVTPAAARALADHAAPDELDEAVAQIAAPWAKWAALVPAIAASRERIAGAAQHERGPRRRPSLEASLTTAEILAACDAPGLSRPAARRDPATEALLVRTATTGAGEARMVALAVLARRGEVGFIAEAEAFLRAEAGDPALRQRGHARRRGWLRYLEALPAAASLPLARRWFAEPWPLSLAAEQIFVRHATEDDRAMLEAAGAEALVTGAMYRLCHVVEALGEIGSAGSIELLCAVLRDVPYSYARVRAVRALQQHTAVDHVRVLLTEALWDCEPDAREVACEVVDPTSETVRARLVELAQDTREDKDIREDARRRLAGEPLDG